MDGSGTADRVDRAALSRQWRQEGRYEEIAEFRQQVKEATKKAWRSAGRHWDRDELNEVAWQEAARAFPPLDTKGMPGTDSQSESAHRGRVQGLGDIPDDWPQLPNNASLQAELRWCQANRLLVVEERGSGATVVRLDRASSPPPSKAALSWLETSIRAYAKYVDVLARSLKDEVDEAANVRRERMQIEDIRALLREMSTEEECRR
jgi:hypothetical protein